MSLLFHGEGLKKVFNRRPIFSARGFTLRERETLLVCGRNGSGKTTFVKLLCRVLTPSAGSLALTVDGTAVGEERWHGHVGLVAPYLQLYEEFTARENLALALSLRGAPPDDAWANSLLEQTGLSARADEPVRTFSSGMKQRVKYAFALMHRPSVLLLDEPMTNLDADGMAFVRTVMARQKQEGMLIVATNDVSDVESYEAKVDLNALS